MLRDPTALLCTYSAFSTMILVSDNFLGFPSYLQQFWCDARSDIDSGRPITVPSYLPSSWEIQSIESFRRSCRGLQLYGSRQFNRYSFNELISSYFSRARRSSIPRNQRCNFNLSKSKSLWGDVRIAYWRTFRIYIYQIKSSRCSVRLRLASNSPPSVFILILTLSHIPGARIGFVHSIYLSYFSWYYHPDLYSILPVLFVVTLCVSLPCLIRERKFTLTLELFFTPRGSLPTAFCGKKNVAIIHPFQTKQNINTVITQTKPVERGCSLPE